MKEAVKAQKEMEMEKKNKFKNLNEEFKRFYQMMLINCRRNQLALLFPEGE